MVLATQKDLAMVGSRTGGAALILQVIQVADRLSIWLSERVK